MPWDKIDTDEDSPQHQDEAVEDDDLAKNTEEAPKTEPIEKERDNVEGAHHSKEKEEELVLLNLVAYVNSQLGFFAAAIGQRRAGFPAPRLPVTKRV